MVGELIPPRNHEQREEPVMFRPATLLQALLVASSVGFSALLLLPPTAAQEEKPKGKGYALLIGVRDYEARATLGPLKYSTNDVEALAKLLDREGSPFHGRVRVLACSREKKGDKPTAQNIRKALVELNKGKGK